MVDKKELNELRSVEELASYQKAVQEGIKELDAESNGLPLKDKEREEFANLVETNREIEKRVKELEARKAIVAEMAEDPKKVERAYSNAERMFNSEDRKTAAKERDIYDISTLHYDGSNPERSKQELRDRAMRAIELAKFPSLGYFKNVSREKVQEHLEHVLESTQAAEGSSESGTAQAARLLLSTGGPVYRKAFWKRVVGLPTDREEERALSLAGSGGGFAIPFALDPSVIPTSNSVVNPMRALARLVTISGANTWQGVTSPAITAAYAAEGTEATDNSTTLVQPQVTVQKAQAFVPFSIEVSEDWPALEAEFGRLLQDAKDDIEGSEFVVGVGTTVHPQGVVVGATTTFAFAAGSLVTFHAADIYNLEAALPPRFRPRSSFIANRGAYNSIRTIDTAGGAALWLYVAQGLTTQAPTPGNTGAILLGRGAWEASAMTGKVAGTFTNADKVMVIGDCSYFLIVDRIGMTVELIPHIFGPVARFPIGQRGLYAYWRNSSKVLSASAFVVGTAAT